jgi:hypothetical protein
MDATQHIRLLQTTYAAQLADATVQYGRAGIIDEVTARHRERRAAGGAAQAARMGITAPAEAFTVSAELFGCADWAVEPEPAGGFAATAGGCLLCGMVKQAGGPSPCRLFCLDPIEAMVRGLAPGAGFEVQETLYDGASCRVRVTGC